VKRKKLFSLLAAVALGLGLTVVVGAPAFATTSPCYTTAGNGNWATSNWVCGDGVGTGYQAVFVKNVGSAQTMDFNLDCQSGRVFGDNGAFTATAGHTYTYVFAVGNQGPCFVIIYNRPAGGHWQTLYFTP
jgi:hypothetical protein